MANTTRYAHSSIILAEMGRSWTISYTSSFDLLSIKPIRAYRNAFSEVEICVRRSWTHFDTSFCHIISNSFTYTYINASPGLIISICTIWALFNAKMGIILSICTTRCWACCYTSTCKVITEIAIRTGIYTGYNYGISE